MKERLVERKRKEEIGTKLGTIFEPRHLLFVLGPIMPGLSPDKLYQGVQKKSILLVRELGLEINLDHHADLLRAIDNHDIIEASLVEAGRYPLLNPNQEQILAQRITEGKGAISLLKQPGWRLRKHKPLVEITFKGAAAGQLLTLCNLRLVVPIAWRYTGRGVSFDELIQEGDLALIRAVEGFEPNKGKFSTYATHTIRRHLQKVIAKNGFFVRLPNYLSETRKELSATRESLIKELGREPTPEEIASRLKIDPKKVQELERATQKPLSLDALHLYQDESGDAKTLYQSIRDEHSPTIEEVEEKIYQEFLKVRMGKIIALLRGRERQVLEMNLGLNGFREHTLIEISKKWGITDERVRQIKEKARERLKQPPYRNQIKALL